jgi:hypothetical protein
MVSATDILLGKRDTLRHCPYGEDMGTGDLIDGPDPASLVLRPGGGSLRYALTRIARAAAIAPLVPLLGLPFWLTAVVLMKVLDGPLWIWSTLAFCYGAVTVAAFATMVSSSRTIYRLDISGEHVRVTRLNRTDTVPTAALHQITITDYPIRPHMGDARPPGAIRVSVVVELVDGTVGSGTNEGADADTLAERLRELLPDVAIERNTEWQPRIRPVPTQPGGDDHAPGAAATTNPDERSGEHN